MSQLFLATLSLSLVAGGGLLGVACARAVPSALAVEATLAAVLCGLLLARPRARSGTGRRAAADGRASRARARGAASASASASDAARGGAPSSVGTSGSDSEGSDGPAASGSEGSAGPGPPRTDAGATAAAPRGRPPATIRVPPPPATLRLPPPPATLRRPPATIRLPPPPATLRVPLHVRVEQERRRISLRGGEEPVGATATAHCLRFPDADGRQVRYTVRTSRKRGSAAFLEVRVEGQRPRRARGLVYDAPSRALRDGRRTCVVPAGDVPLVLRSLTLLCKVCAVPLAGTPAAGAVGARAAGRGPCARGPPPRGGPRPRAAT